MDGRRGGWRVAVVVLVLVSVVPSVLGGAVAAPTVDVGASTGGNMGAKPVADTGATARTVYLDHNVTLGDTPGRVEVRVTLHDEPGLESFRMDIPEGAEVTSTDGFESSYGVWAWDGSPSNPTLTYELAVDDPGDTRLRGEDWAFVSHLDGRIAWTESRDVEVERRFDAGGGYAGDDGVAVGNVTVRTFTTPNEESTVVVPTALVDDVDPAAVGNVTTDLGRWMPAGERRPRTNVFVVPEEADIGAAGVAIGGGDFLVKASFAGGTHPLRAGIFAHEYAHTRQSFDTGAEMAWFTEGDARYYEHRYVYERRGRSFGTYRSDVSVVGTPYANATLSAVHPTSTAAYQKGAHVLTALDVLMRQRSDGEAGVDDLLDRMNGHEGEVSYDDFRSMVRAEAGTGLDGWLDLYVRGEGVPKLPDNGSLVAPVGWDSSEAPGNLYVCVGGEWRTRPSLLPKDEPVQVFDATYAVTRFSNATRVAGSDGPCDPDDLPVTTSKYGEPVPRRYEFEGDTTLTFRSAFDPADVTTLEVAVVDLSTPTPTPMPSPTPPPSPSATVTAVPTGGTSGQATERAGSTATPTAAPAADSSDLSSSPPPLVVEPREAGLLVQRGAVSAVFPLPLLVGMAGFLAAVAGASYLLFRE